MKITQMPSAAFVLAVAALAADPVTAEPVLLEQAIESTTRQTVLPDGGGTLVVRPCEECDALYLSIDIETASFIGTERVGYGELQQMSRRRNTALYVFYDAESRKVTRLKLDRDGR